MNKEINHSKEKNEETGNRHDGNKCRKGKKKTKVMKKRHKEN